jgi:hypothetical protein
MVSTETKEPSHGDVHLGSKFHVLQGVEETALTRYALVCVLSSLIQNMFMPVGVGTC